MDRAEPLVHAGRARVYLKKTYAGSYLRVLGVIVCAIGSHNTLFAQKSVTHPFILITQQQIDNLKSCIETGTNSTALVQYNKLSTFGSAHLNDAPAAQTVSDDWLINYKNGLIDTEKATAWAIMYHVEDDLTYATKARDFAMHYVGLGWSMQAHILADVSHTINNFIVYDLTVNSGAYSSSDIEKFNEHLRSRADSGLETARRDPYWKENMSHWITGMGCMAALILGDENYISRGYTEFRRRIDVTSANGSFFDYDYRGDEGLGYNIFCLVPLAMAAHAANNYGLDWWNYSSNGRSLSNCFDFLTKSSTQKPNSDWIPTIYGNLNNEPAGDGNWGEYAKGLTEKILTDQRFIFEIARNNIKNPVYDDIVNDSSNGRNPANDLYDYHVLYWMGAFLNVPKSDPTRVVQTRGNSEWPKEYALAQSYPNPFNPVTRINFSIPEYTFVSLKVFTIQGREIATLVSKELSPGHYEVKWDGSNFTSGVYVYSLRTPSRQFWQKLTLQK